MMFWGLDFEHLLLRARTSTKASLAIVYFSFLLDGFLLTVVVPIIPDYLYQLELEADKNLPEFNSSLYTSNDSYVLPQDIINENSKVGWLFSSKAIVQLLANALVGPWTSRIGYTIPLFSGAICLAISALGFALSQTYLLLFISRSVHGIGSACVLIAGMGLLAETYQDDRNRSKAMGVALGGQAVGVLTGYPAGGLLYQFVGKTLPFMICAVALLINAGIQIVIMVPSCYTRTEKMEGTPLYQILRDPYILVAAGALTLPEMAMAMLEPTLPIWLADNMHLQKWQVGMIFIPDSVGFLIGTSAFGLVSYKIGRWLCSIASLLMVGTCLMIIPLASEMPHLIAPHFGMGFGLGVIDATIMPLLALLVDMRHVAHYGSVYAIAQFSISIGFAVGPSVGGQVVKSVGFTWLLRGMAICNIIYCPLCYFLKDPPQHKGSQTSLLGPGSPVSGVGPGPSNGYSMEMPASRDRGGRFQYEQFH